MNEHIVPKKEKEEPDELKEIAAAMAIEAKKCQSDELRIAFVARTFHLLEWTTLLARLAQVATQETICVTQVLRRAFGERQNFGYSENKEKDLEANEQLTKFLSLICRKKIKFNQCESFDDFKSESLENYDIISYLFERGLANDLEERVKWLINRFSNSSHFFALKGVDEEGETKWEGPWRWKFDTGVQFFSRVNDKDKPKLLKFTKTLNWFEKSRNYLWSKLISYFEK